MSDGLAALTAESLAEALSHADAFLVPGSRPAGALRQDLESIEAAPPDMREVRTNLHATLVSTAEMLLAHARDHVLALANDVERQPSPIWSGLTLSRAVLESTAWMRHLLDPSVSSDMRLCRIAALWLDDSEHARIAAATFTAEDAADVSAYHEFKLAELAAGGFSVERNARGRILRVRLGRASAALNFKLTPAITGMLPEGMPSPYRLGSGAAHARPWMLERSATRTPDGDLGGERTTATAAALTVMFCMVLWVTAWGGYFGLDVTSQIAAIESIRRTYVQRGMSS